MPPDFMKYYREPLYRNSLAILLSVASSSFFGLLFWIAAARTISSTDIGLATAAFAAGTLIVNLSRLGMDQGLVRFLPESRAKSELYSTIVVVALMCSLILSVIFFAGLEFFSPALLWLREGWFIAAFIGYVTIYSVYTSQNSALLSLRKGGLYLVQNIVFGLRVLVLLPVASLAALGIFVSFNTALVAAFVFGALALYWSGLSLRLQIDTASLREIIGFSLGNYTATILLIVPVSIVPVLILNTVGAQANAYFYIAYSIAALLLAIPSAVSLSLFVEGSHNVALRENAIKSLRFTLLLLAPAVVFVLVFGDKLLLLFGQEYSEEAFALLRLLAVSSVFAIVTLIYASIKKVQKDIRAINYVNFALTALIIGSCYAFLLQYGLIGVGYGWLLSNAAVAVVVGWIVVKRESWFR